MSEIIMLPGPTPVTRDGLQAQSQQIIGHREKKFSRLLQSVTENLQQIFMTDNDILIFPASGTGGLEIAIVNTLSPGDKVLSISNGVFAGRFRKIARTYNIDIIEMDFPWGKPCNYKKIKYYINNHPELKAILFTHNETSTGIENNIKRMGEIVKDHGALLIVDAVSSLGGIPVKTDDWGLDIVITSSQKALMTPPGLAILAVSDAGWARIEKSSLPRYYWDLKKSRKYYRERKQTPYTPAISLLYALDRAVNNILEEGLEKVFKKHRIHARGLRTGMKKLGFKPFVPRQHASCTVTAFYQPEGIDFPSYRKHLLVKYGIHFAGGQQKLKNTIFRVGHMGAISREDIINTVKYFGKGLLDYGQEIDQKNALRETKLILDEGSGA